MRTVTLTQAAFVAGTERATLEIWRHRYAPFGRLGVPIGREVRLELAEVALYALAVELKARGRSTPEACASAVAFSSAVDAAFLAPPDGERVFVVETTFKGGRCKRQSARGTEALAGVIAKSVAKRATGILALDLTEFAERVATRWLATSEGYDFEGEAAEALPAQPAAADLPGVRRQREKARP